jgi:hypothetical protein
VLKNMHRIIQGTIHTVYYTGLYRGLYMPGAGGPEEARAAGPEAAKPPAFSTAQGPGGGRGEVKRGCEMKIQNSGKLPIKK